jgi:thiol-disulfide isomerase/thioredoxin
MRRAQRAAGCVAGARRTAALGMLALPLLLWAGAGAAQPVRRITWTDVPLLDGSVMRAGDLHGRAVVVELWASWCPFCARQNPHLQKLHEATRGKGLVVLTFSIDRDDATAIAYLRKHGYTFAAARLSPQVEAWFGRRRALPEVYVVDPQGRVVLREEGEMFPEDVAALARFAAGG